MHPHFPCLVVFLPMLFIRFSYQFAFPELVTVYEEYLIYDTIGMIGSIGGTLGIFIGFSLSNVISFLINCLRRLRIEPRKLCKKKEKQQLQFLRKIKVSDKQCQPYNNQLQSQINQLQNQINQSQNQINQLQNQINQSQNQINQLKNQIN